ncbi:MAG: hypothetical protein OES32_07915 [Acidobacteriota bacterium]|nr:hypothetical protein [Acidobacteriota bacterium]
MPRTTLNIDTPILDEVKRLQREEGSSLGRVVTQLLAEALERRGGASAEPTGLEWISRPLGALVDLADRDAVYDVLDDDAAPGR